MKKATKKWMAVLMLLVMLFDAAPLPVLAEELPQGSDLLTADYSEPKQLDFTLPEYTLTEDEFTVSPVKDMQSLISAVNKPVPMKRGLLKAAARNTAEQNQQADAATASITGYAAFDIKLTEGAHKAESYSVPVSFDAPIDVFANNPDRNASIVRVSCTLYHFQEDGSYTVVKDAQVNWADNLLTGFTFTTDGFSAFLLKYTVDFVYIEKTGNISLNFENAKETGNEFGQLIQKNAQGLEEIAVADILNFIAQDADHQQFSGEVYTLSLSDATALADFNADFFSAAGVDIEGKGVEYGSGTITLIDSFDSAKITFAANHTTLELTLQNYTKPIPPIAYAFHGVGVTASISEILASAGIVSSYYNTTLSDEEAVSVEEDTLTTLSFFDEVTLTLTLEDESAVTVILTNPEFIAANQLVSSEAGSYAPTTELAAGAELKVKEAEENEAVTEQAKAELGEDAHVKFYDLSIVDAEGNKIDTGATVTLNLGIALDVPEDKLVKVSGFVYHVTDEGVELLDADFKLDNNGIASVTFSTDGFSLFGIAYTVDFVASEVSAAWSWPGQGSYSIADILNEIGVDGKAESVELKLTKAVGETSEAALYLTQDEVTGEYSINSDAAFDDTYELTVVVDGTKYVLTVTDDVLDRGVTVDTYFLTSGHVQNAEAETGETLNARVALSDANPNPTAGNYTYVKVSITKDPEVILDGYWQDGARSQIIIQNGTAEPTVIWYTYHENNGNPYIIYELPAGATGVVDLPFKTPNGTTPDGTQVTISAEFVNPVQGAANDSISAPAVGAWTSEFKWDDIDKTVSSAVQHLTADNQLTDWLQYTFSANTQNKSETGAMWTDTITLTDTLTLPEGLTFETTGSGTVTNTGTAINFELNGKHVFGLSGLSGLEIVGTPDIMVTDSNHLTYSITIRNPNRDSNNNVTAEMDSFNYHAEFNLGTLDMTSAFIAAAGSDPRPEITNTVSVTETALDGRTQTSTDTVTTQIRANEGYELTKSSVPDGGEVQSDDTIQYTVSLTNTGSAPFSADDGDARFMKDQLPNAVEITPDQLAAVQIKLYNVSATPATEITLTSAELEEIRAKLTYNNNTLQYDASGLGAKQKIEFVYSATVKDAEALQWTPEGTVITNHVNYKDAHSYTSTTLKKPHYNVDKALVGTTGSQSHPAVNGDKVVYKLTATANQGDVSSVVMYDTLPAYMQLQVYDSSKNLITDFYTDSQRYQKWVYHDVLISDGNGNFFPVKVKTDWEDRAYLMIEKNDGLTSGTSAEYYYEVVFDADKAASNVDQNGYVNYTNIVTTLNGDHDEEGFVGGYGKLTVDKTHNPKGLKEGQEVTSPYQDDTLLTYYVTVNNDANNPYTKNITVHDEIPAGLFPVLFIPESSTEATKAELDAYLTNDNYFPVTINNREAQIKRYNGGYDIIWVIQNPQTPGGTDYITSETVSYQARIVVDDITLNAAGYAQLKNRAWVPGSEKIDLIEIKEAGLEMDKIAIESEPHLLLEDRLVKIQPGSTVTYRLTLTNPTNRDIVATDVRDMLPVWPGLSPLDQSNNYWSSANVTYDTTSPDCFDQHFASIYDYGSNVSNNKINWRPIKVPAHTTLTTTVTITFPDSVNLATAMFKQSGHDTKNYFHVYGLEDKTVDHILATDQKFDLRKSVVGFSKFESGTQRSVYSGTSRDIFKKGEINEVTYAVAFANTGASTIHLINFQDDLPDCMELVSVYGNAEHWMYNYGGITAGCPDQTTSYFANEYDYDSNVLDQGWEGQQFSVKNDSNTNTGTITFTLEAGSGIDVPPRKAVVFYLRCKIKDGQESLTGIDAITNSIRATMDGDADIKSTRLDVKRGYDEYNSSNNIPNQNSGDCTIVDKSNNTTTTQSSVTIHPLDVFVPGVKKQATHYKAYDPSTGSNYAGEWTAVTSDHEQNFKSQGLVEWTVTLYNDGTEAISEGYTVVDRIPMGHHLTRTVHDSDLGVAAENVFVTSYIIYDASGNQVRSIPATDSVFTNAVISETDADGGGKTATFVFGNDTKYEIPAGGRAEMKIVTDFIGSNQYMGQIKNNATFIPAYPDWNPNLVTKGQLVKNENGDQYIGVSSSDYINAYGDYATTSIKKVEAVDDPSNCAYGYEDTNYITVPVGTSRVKYTLQVSNLASNALTDFVVIDRMPEIGDTGVINHSEQRGSEFSMGMVASGLKVSVKEPGDSGTVYVLTAASGAYRIQYSAKTEFSTNDLNGTETAGWHDTLQAGDKSFRIMLDKQHTGLTDTSNNQIVVPKSGGKVIVEFYASIDSSAVPGQFAYNSFGYWFKNTQGDHSEAEPSKAGVKIERQPSIQKQVLDENDQPLPADPTKEFIFNFYDVTNYTGNIAALTAEQIKAMTPAQLAAENISPVTTVNPLTLTQGASADLVKQQTINGTTRGDFIDGHTYLVIEEPCSGYYSAGYTVDGLKRSDGEILSFVYHSANKVTVIALNKEDMSGWEPEASKTLITTAGTPLAANQFSFTLYEVANHGEANESARLLETVSNDGAGKVTFTRIQYQAVDTHWYRMQEVAGQNGNIVYDTSIYDVKVEVTERNGKFMATPTYYKNGTALPAGSVPGFVNTESTQIQVQKVWAGEVTTGSATMVLYRSATAPTGAFDVTVNATLSGTPVGSATITATFTGEGDTQSVVLGNGNWSDQVALKRGVNYTVTYTTNKPDKITFTSPTTVSGITDPTTLTVTANAVAADQYAYTFTVPSAQRPANNKGSVRVTMNGTQATLSNANDWTATFTLTEETAYSYTAVPGDGFVTAVSPSSGNGTASASDSKNISLTLTNAPQTMNIPVSVNWGSGGAPDSGDVTVTLTPISGTTLTETLSGSTWSGTFTDIPRIDDNGNLIEYTIDVNTIADGVTVSVATPSNGKISGSGSITIDGMIARGMTVNIRYDSTLNYVQARQWFITNTNGTAYLGVAKDENDIQPSILISANQPTTATVKGLPIVDSNGNPIVYAFWFQGSANWEECKVNISINAVAGKGNVYEQEVAYFTARAGEVNIVFSKAYGDTNTVTGINTSSSFNSVNMFICSSQFSPISNSIHTLSLKTNKTITNKKYYDTSITDTTGDTSFPAAQEKYNLSSFVLVADGSGTDVHMRGAAETFADASVGGSGTPFTVIQAKDLPADAVVASDITGYEYTITGAGSYTWENLPLFDEDGKRIYYYVVEKTASANASSMSVRYGYTYNTANDANSGISVVTVTNTTTAPPKGDLRITKAVTVDDNPTSTNLADGTYNFTITGPENYNHTASITVTGGVATSTIDLTDLTLGDYTITETGSTDGHATLSGRAVTGTGSNSGDNAIVLTVTASSTVENTIAAFTNNVNTGTATTPDTVTVNKTDGTSALTGAKFALYTDAQCTGTPIKTYDLTSASSFAISTNDNYLASYLPANSGGTTTLYLKEIEAPANHRLDSTVYTVTITKSVSGLIWNSTENKYIDTTSYDIKINNSDDPLTVVNTPLGSISVTKTVTGSYTTTTDTYPITIMKDNKYVDSNSQLVDDDPQLTVTAGQTLTINDLPVGDYVVTEGAVSKTGYEITTTYTVGGTGAVTATASVTKGNTAAVGITNHYRDAQLVIKKTVTGPALADALAKITFTIEDVTTGITDAEKTATITIRGSTLTTTETYGSVTLTSVANGIKPDHTYKVTETIDDTLTGYKWKSVTTTIVTGNTTTSGTTTDATVTLTNGDTSSGEIDFANTYGDLIDVSGTKTWRVSSGVTPDNTKITLKLERTAKPGTDSSTWETVTATPTWSGNTYTFSGLDKYNDSNVEYEYRVSEVSFIIDEVTYTIGSDGIATPDDNTKPVMKMTQSGNNFTNEELTVRHATKTWVDDDNAGGLRPESITFTLSATVGGTALAADQLTALGISETSKTIQPDAVTGLWPSADWTNLPMYTNEGELITYDVEETAVANYTQTAKVWDEDTKTWAFTNTLNETDIKVLKQDATNQQALSGASFQLFKVTTETIETENDGTSTREVATPYPDDDASVQTTTATGTITFNNLVDGNYKLVETQAPAGYISLGQEITFTITGGAVVSNNASSIGAVTYTPASGAEPATFTMDNTPGAELPATGGPGTAFYTVTGLTLTLSAALWLMFRRRKEQQN